MEWSRGWGGEWRKQNPNKVVSVGDVGKPRLKCKPIREVRCTFLIDQIVTFNLQNALKIKCSVTPYGWAFPQ